MRCLFRWPRAKVASVVYGTTDGRAFTDPDVADTHQLRTSIEEFLSDLEMQIHRQGEMECTAYGQFIKLRKHPTFQKALEVVVARRMKL